jgi:hypothetical protein
VQEIRRVLFPPPVMEDPEVEVAAQAPTAAGGAKGGAAKKDDEAKKKQEAEEEPEDDGIPEEVGDLWITCGLLVDCHVRPTKIGVGCTMSTDQVWWRRG